MTVRYLFFFLSVSMTSFGQLSDDPEGFIAKLRTGGPVPEKLLSTRTVVIYPYTMKDKELQDIQKSFQQTGIDAVAYYKMDLIVAGKDVAAALSHYFSRRNIVNMIFFQKEANQYTVYITGFNTKDSFIEENQIAWSASDPSLAELLRKVYRSAAGSLKRKNLLINDFPETNLGVNPIVGRRSEFFAIDLKVDQLAVPKTGNDSVDKDLEILFADYPFKYKLTEPGLSERELRSQGFLYVLCFVHARGTIAREVLGYDTGKSESAYVSVTYANGDPQLKNIPANTPVYKFYFKHIESGNVFLGTKWDADTTWQQALKNHLMAFKKELKLN